MSSEKAPVTRVFVSSTFLDNEDRRRRVHDAIQRAGMLPVGMERFTASTRPTVEECEAQVRGCEWFVGILAHRYGWVPPGQDEGAERSITEIEYDTAKDEGMPRLMFVIDSSVMVNPQQDYDTGPDKWKKQELLERFKEKVARDQKPAMFTDEDLGVEVLQALGEERERQQALAAASQAKRDPAAEPETPQVLSPATKPRSLEAEIDAYLASAVAIHQKITLAGFETRIRVPILFDELHVPLRAVLDRRVVDCEVAKSAEEAMVEFARSGAASELPLSEAFGFARRHGERRGLVILGDPGSGKTTHLKRILLSIAKEGAPSLGLPEGTVPVFLPLRNLEDLEHGLDAFIEQELSDPHLKAPDDLGTKLEERGKVLYLLDGLDEVRDADDRARVARWVDRALKLSPDCYFVVTCRYAGYTNDARLREEFLELHLRPLTDAQVEQFVTRWFSIVETHLVEEGQRPQALRDAEIRTENLLADLRQSDLQASARVYELTHNPLLLTTICLVHRDRGRLPERRVELYDECVNVLLEHWNKAKDAGTTAKKPKRSRARIPASDARQVLQPLARWLHQEEGRTRASAEELGPELGKALQEAELKVGPGEFLQSIRDESGLLTGWGVDEYGFMHLGFQEYLAAREIRNQEILEPGPFRELSKRFGESWWQEVILLMLAQKDPPLFDRFMREVVRQPEFPQWAGTQMMNFCLREAAGVKARPFVELVRGPVSQGMESQQLAAAQVLARSMPETLAGLEDVLAKHPAELVRRWWVTRQVKEAPGDTIVVAGGVKLVLIPGGVFKMGSPDGVGYDDEQPQHEVKLASFRLARTPVTNAQYGEFLRANPSAEKPALWGDRNFNHPDQPVVGVSWHEAKAYCVWAELSLPTEAQWEYACRAGTSTAYWSGNSREDLARVGWYDDNSGGRLHGVAELGPNGFGLYDMHGNVWEWCEDRFSKNYEGAEHRDGDGLRIKPEGVAYRVVRGGGWFNHAVDARSAYRSVLRPEDRGRSLGFRPVQVIP